MSRTRAVALVFALALLPGCAAWIETRRTMGPEYDAAGRPASSYYCYDCHGYRYFDPYYDWCVGYGFRYAWDRHPETVTAYRERYLRIKEQNPGYGRYRYRTDYRSARRYRQPQDYDSWRGAGSPGQRDGRLIKDRENTRQEPGSNRRKDRDRKTREHRPDRAPRSARPPAGQ